MDGRAVRKDSNRQPFECTAHGPRRTHAGIPSRGKLRKQIAFKKRQKIQPDRVHQPMPCLVRVRILIKLEVVLTVNTKNAPVSRTKPKEKDPIKQFMNMRVSYPTKVPCFSFTYPTHTHHVLYSILSQLNSSIV